MPRMDKLSSYKTVWIDNEEGGLVIYQKTKIVEWDNNGNVTLTVMVGKLSLLNAR